MMNKFSHRFSELRKQKGFTQEQIAELLGVTSQAVSKWENDLSYPDITLLPKLAELLNTTIDDLLGYEHQQAVQVLPEKERKDINTMLLKIRVMEHEGDKVKMNLPLSLIKVGLEIGMQMPQVTAHESIKDINFEQVIQLVESGVIGKVVDIETKEGDHIEIIVE